LKVTALSPVAAEGGVSLVAFSNGVIVLSAQDARTGCWMIADNTTPGAVLSGAYNFPGGVSYGWFKSTSAGQKCFIGRAPAGYPLSTWKPDFKTLAPTAT